MRGMKALFSRAPIFPRLPDTPPWRATTQEGNAMRHPHFSQDHDEIGTIWYLIPVMWLFIAAAGFAVLTYWPALVAEAGQPGSASAASASAPYVSSDPSVPAAIGVFGDRSYEVVDHVEAF
jgi:hypothetical protein